VKFPAAVIYAAQALLDGFCVEVQITPVQRARTNRENMLGRHGRSKVP